MAEQAGMKNGAVAELPSTYVSAAGTKMLPMKLFSWEVEKSTPNSIPRLCGLTLTRLTIKRVLEPDLHSVIIAIKMQGSKRILRSNEILVQKGGTLDMELDLTFSLQYLHHLKRDRDNLQVMLQRRKKYKNRTMLGFKTLAVGQVSMSQVLQHPVDREMNLHSCTKDGRSEAVARVVIMSLSSQPVDQDDRTHVHKDRYQYDLSDEDEMPDDGDISSNDGLSDFEMGEVSIPRQRNKTSSLGNAFAAQVLESAVHEIGEHGGDDDIFDDVDSLTDSNSDTGTISLQSAPKPKLRPFFDANGSIGSSDNCKPLDHETVLDSNKKQEVIKQEQVPSRKNEKSMSELFGKKLSEKTILDFGSSVANKKQIEKSSNIDGSTKKSSDKPISDLFSKKNDKNTVEVFSKKSEKGLDGKQTSESVTLKKTAENVQPRKVERKIEFNTSVDQKLFQDQLNIIASIEHALPECIVFMNYQEPLCPMLNTKFQDAKIYVINTSAHADVKAALNSIVNRIQKSMNTSYLKLKLAIVGSEGYVHSVVRPYVKLLSSRSPELINHVRFVIVPLGSSFLCQNLAMLDSRYAKLFNDSYWKGLNTEKFEEEDLDEMVTRISIYISEASQLLQLPFAEIVLTNKEKGIDDSSQMVVPFLGEIKIKPLDVGSDIDDATANSPPQGSFLDKLKEVTSHSINVSTPSQQSPATSTASATIQSITSTETTTTSPSSEELELQMDYWLLPKQDQLAIGSAEKAMKKDAKFSLKTAFRSVQIFRPSLPLTGPHHQQQLQFSPSLTCDSMPPSASSGLSMVFITKDKKQKIMRLGKKSKEIEALKSQQIDGISRLICTSKSQNQLLTVNIDGMDWTGIKFFQAASHWQTHFKHLPVLIFGFSS